MLPSSKSNNCFGVKKAKQNKQNKTKQKNNSQKKKKELKFITSKYKR